MATRRRTSSRSTHGDVFLHHQMKIARQTLKYSDIGARIMGGMTKEEARELIRRHGGGETEIRRLESNPRRRGRHARRTNPGGTRYRGVVTAYPGHLLRGGKKQVKSSWFNSKKEAADWNYAMEQAGSSHHIERGAPTKRRNASTRVGKFKGRTTHPGGGPITLRDQFRAKAYVGRKKSSRPRYLVGFGQGGTSDYINAKKLSTAKVKGEAYAKKRGWGSFWVQNQVTGSILQFNVTHTLDTAKRLLKSNPNRLTDVLVKRNGRVFKAKAKYDAKLGRVRIFANPKVVRKINPESGKPKLTPQQKKALAAYNFALQQEDRYLGSVFVTPTGQRRVEAVTKEAYDRCKRLGMDHTHGL